jgi:hypothetical protein
MHVGAILVDPCAYLISSADGPVAGDMDELRRAHPGAGSPARSPSVRERLNAAYLAAAGTS